MLNIVKRLLPEFGTTYGPAGHGPFPAIMVLHGSEGGFSGWSHCTSMLLASHGFIAYPHAYSQGGNAWNAGAIKDVPIEHTANALTALRKFKYTSDRAGVYGVSRGGEHALLLASLLASENTTDQPDALAAHSAPDVICGAFNGRTWRDSGDPGWQAWDPSERAWTWRGDSENLKPTTTIEIERYQGPLFLSHGTKDRMWSVKMTKRLEQKLKEREAHLEVHYYEGEEHLCSDDADNKHNEMLVRFFTRFLQS